MPSVSTGFLMSSCVIGQMNSNGMSVRVKAMLNRADLTSTIFESIVNLPVTSHMITDLSFDPDAISVDSLFTATELTYRECSASVFKQLP